MLPRKCWIVENELSYGKVLKLSHNIQKLEPIITKINFRFLKIFDLKINQTTQTVTYNIKLPRYGTSLESSCGIQLLWISLGILIALTQHPDHLLGSNPLILFWDPIALIKHSDPFWGSPTSILFRFQSIILSIILWNLTKINTWRPEFSLKL